MCMGWKERGVICRTWYRWSRERRRAGSRRSIRKIVALGTGIGTGLGIGIRVGTGIGLGIAREVEGYA